MLLTGLLLLPLVLADRGYALDPAKDLKQYNLRTWNRRAGLPATSINAIAQTKDGYLWFGTSAGLLRFDGTEFKALDLHSVAALRTSYVTSLASARAGGLWVGLEHSAFGFYDGQTFSFRGSNVVALDVLSLLESRNGTLWLAAEQEADRVNPSGELETVLPSAAFTNTTANTKCVYEDREDRVWIGTLTQGAFYWKDGKITQLPAPELEGSEVMCITEDLAGQIWIGTGNGLYCYDASLKRREIPPLPSAISALLVDRQGVLWIGTSWVGLARYLNGHYDYFLKTDGLDNDNAQALFEDSEGSLWIGTGGGLDQLSDVKFPIQPATDDPKITDANSVTAARHGGVWIASYGGVRLFDPQTKTYTTTNEPGLPDTFTKRVFEARNGNLYFVCGTTNLVVSSGGKIVATYGAPDLVVAMAEDDQGVVVSVAGNLYRAGTNYFRPYTFKTNVPPEFYWISNLASGKDGVIWVACGNGIFRIKDGVWQHWAGPEGLVDSNVQTVTEDQDGVLWAGLHSGIARLKDNQIRLISRKDGLFDNDIYAIVPDDLGNLWVDSVRGTSRVALRDINAFADGKTNHVACTVFDGLDSVKTTDKTAQERVGCKTADGRIWFPEPLGVVMIDPAHMPANPVAPTVHIERVLADGREVARKASIVVPPGNDELEFDFNALSFSAPSRVQIRYRLEGYDKDWVDAGNRHMTFYTNLKPGRYTFSVIAANADGVWNERGDTLNVELRPHYYQTAWFRLLCGGLAFAALIGIYLLRVRHLNLQQQALQKNRDLLESEVQKRTAELAKTNLALQKNIAERKQMEEALAVERNLLRAVIDLLPDCIYAKDTSHRFLLSNEACAVLMGAAAPAELIGKTDADFYPSELEADFRTEELSVFKGVPLINKAEPATRPNGTREFILTTKVPLKDGSGKTIGLVGCARFITERKRAEEALQQERNLLRTLMDHIPDYIYVRDFSNRFIVANESFARLMGAPRPAALIGKQDADFYPAEMASSFDKVDQEVFAGRLILNRERVLLFPNGQELVVLTTKVPFRNDKGEVIGLIGIGRDITERKLTEAALAAEQRLLNSLITTIPDKIYFKDRESRFVRVNEAFAQQHGLSDPSTVLGKTDFDLFGEQHARQAYADEQRILATGEPIIDKEEQEDWKDGHVTWASSTKMPLRDADGKIVGIMGISHDITERKRARQQLDEALNFNQKIILAASVGMVVFKASGQCVMANETAARTLGATVPALLTHNFRQLTSWRASGMLPMTEKVLATNESRQGEFHFVSTFGKEVSLECHFSPFIQNGEPHLLVIFNDVTEKKKLESQFLRSQRMESIGTLAGGIAHDLNNVLAPLLISVQLLKEKVSDEDGRRLLDSLEANVNRGASLVKQVLTFGRGIKGERIPIHLKHIGDGIAQMIHATFPKSLKFEIQCAGDLWTVIGDPTQLEQVLMNLCVNARDAMPGGGTLSIRMGNTVFDEHHATANLEAKHGNYAVISVSDTGTGMAPEIRDRIFEPFFTTKQQGKGTGLGLSTTLAIVKSHGGFINCYSEVGKGSVFKVYLPASPDAADVKPAAANQSRLPRGNNELVLVVDDEEPIRIFAKSMLERFGYRILLAANGAEAVKLYTSRGNEIAAVITDMSMPGMDGPATIAALRAINLDVKVIGSSGLDVRDGVSGVVNAGLVHFMSKPYTAEAVLNMLHEVLRENPAK